MKNLAVKAFAGATTILSMFSFVGCGDVSSHSIYQFEVDNVTQVTANEVTKVDVTLKATDIRSEGYEHVLIKIDATNKDNLEIKATDTQSQEWDVIQTGSWGPPEGFAISNDYEATTEFRVNAQEEGIYTVTFDLVDLDNNELILATKTMTFTAVGAEI